MDVGQDFTLLDRTANVVLSPFVGFNYWEESVDGYGARCNRDDVGGLYCGPPGSIAIPFSTKVITDTAQWSSLRLGAEMIPVKELGAASGRFEITGFEVEGERPMLLQVTASGVNYNQPVNFFRGYEADVDVTVYDAFDQITAQTEREGVEVFREALENLRPAVEVQSRRVGGASYQVPIEVRSDRRTALALRWLVRYAQSRSGKSMVGKLAQELMDAAGKNGAAYKKKEDTHRMAEANRAFAHFRF